MEGICKAGSLTQVGGSGHVKLLMTSTEPIMVLIQGALSREHVRVTIHKRCTIRSLCQAKQREVSGWQFYTLCVGAVGTHCCSLNSAVFYSGLSTGEWLDFYRTLGARLLMVFKLLTPMEIRCLNVLYNLSLTLFPTSGKIRKCFLLVPITPECPV